MSRLGPSPARDPITGEIKRAKESILAFAERHGWELEEDSDPDEFIDILYVRKGERYGQVDLLRNGNRNVGKAILQGIPLSQRWGFPIRERVEAFLSGVKCICDPQRDLYHYERVANPACPIHRDDG